MIYALRQSRQPACGRYSQLSITAGALRPALHYSEGALSSGVAAAGNVLHVAATLQRGHYSQYSTKMDKYYIVRLMGARREGHAWGQGP